VPSVSSTLVGAVADARDWATAGPFRAGVVVALGLALVLLVATGAPTVAAAGFALGLPFALIGTYAIDTVRVWRDWLGGPDSPLADRPGRSTGRRAGGDRTGAGTDTRAQLVRLRERYVEGELDEAQFERKLSALLETDTPEAARDHLRRSRRSTADASPDADRTPDDAGPDRVRDPDPERERERERDGSLDGGRRDGSY
jgi:hypothetical protein